MADKQLITEPNTEGIYMAVIRRSPHSLFNDIAKWFTSLGIKQVLSHCQSESDGNITITVFFRK